MHLSLLHFSHLSIIAKSIYQACFNVYIFCHWNVSLLVFIQTVVPQYPDMKNGDTESPVSKSGVRISNHMENPDIECPVINAGMNIYMHDSISRQKKPGNQVILILSHPVIKK